MTVSSPFFAATLPLAEGRMVRLGPHLRWNVQVADGGAGWVDGGCSHRQRILTLTVSLPLAHIYSAHPDLLVMSGAMTERLIIVAVSAADERVQ